MILQNIMLFDGMLNVKVYGIISSLAMNILKLCYTVTLSHIIPFSYHILSY